MSRPARPEVLAFLDAIKDDPHDATAWLVLTDWLEEFGDEDDRARAEYIRLDNTALGKPTYASDWEQGERRRALFKKHGKRWLGPLEEFRPQVRGGLLKLKLTEATFLTLERDVGGEQEAWAWVGNLSLGTLGTYQTLTCVLSSPLLSGLLGLALNGRLQEQDALALAACPRLSRLRQLTLGMHSLGLTGARALVESPYLARLERLGTWGSHPPLSPDIRRVLEERFGYVRGAY